MLQNSYTLEHNRTRMTDQDLFYEKRNNTQLNSQVSMSYYEDTYISRRLSLYRLE